MKIRIFLYWQISLALIKTNIQVCLLINIKLFTTFMYKIKSDLTLSNNKMKFES